MSNSEHPDPAHEPRVPQGLPDEPSPDGETVEPHELVGPVPPDGGIPQFVTDIKSVERQVGEHVVGALRHPDTVAVLSAVMPGGTTAQRLVSIPLEGGLFQQVQELILRVQRARLEQAERERAGGGRRQSVPCIGFKCVLERREQAAEEEAAELAPPEAEGDQPD
jgi:hypothetical protein